MSDVQPVMASSVPAIFCSVNQAAHALGIEPYTMRELCKAGVIEAAKHSGRWLVSVDDLNRYANDIKSRGRSA